jgi:hypothetical protein
MPREEQIRLLNLYKASVSNYSTSVNDLTVTRGKTSKHDYDRLVALRDKARTASEVARLALDRHTWEHAC